MFSRGKSKNSSLHQPKLPAESAFGDFLVRVFCYMKESLTPASPPTPSPTGEGGRMLRRALVKVHVALNPTNIHLLFHTSQIY